MTTDAALSPAEGAALAALERLGAPFEFLPCDPAFADTAAFCRRYGYPAGHAGNTLLVVAKTEPRRYAACLVLATTRLDVNRRVRGLLGGGRCSFASAEEMRALTGMEVGGVTAFGLPEGVPLYVDARVMALDHVILGTGGRHGKVRVAPAVLARVPGAQVIEGLAVEVPAPGGAVPPGEDPRREAVR
jgi:prolyl-tRNA editing enzyme YbaK/EbsC (Cys-tRNA(Pro) deacylase)